MNSLAFVFCTAEYFNMNEVKLIISFIDHAFGVGYEKPLPFPRSSRCGPMLSSRNFTVLYFTFRIVINFELIFLKCIKSVS